MTKIISFLIVCFTLLLSACGDKNICSVNGCGNPIYQDGLCIDHLKDKATDTLVLIGPEGDFSIDEVRMAVEAGFVSVDLGKSRLRTETAGLAAVMMMQLSQQ